jgi:hypothetical protein
MVGPDPYPLEGSTRDLELILVLSKVEFTEVLNTYAMRGGFTTERGYVLHILGENPR